MADLPDKRTNENTDADSDALNPERRREAARELREQEEGVTPYENSRSKGGVASDETKTREEAGAPTNYVNNYTGKHRASKGPWQQRMKKLFRTKKGGATGLIITLIIGGIFGIGTLLTPASLLFNLKNVLLDKFNDQLTVMDKRTTVILKKKIQGDVTTGCGAVIKVRCKYQTMSNRMVKKLEKSGELKVIGDKKTITGRTKVTAIEYNGKQITARNLISEMQGDPLFKKQLLYAYNPKFAGFADRAFQFMADRKGISKIQNLKGETDEELRKSMIDRANGTAAIQEKFRITEQTDEDGNTRYYGPDGNEITDPDVIDQYKTSLASEVEARKALGGVGSQVAKSTAKGALLSTAMGLGALDSGCTGYRLIRTVGFAAKVIGSSTLARYAQIYLNQADVTTAGDAEAKQNEFLGNILTSENSAGQSFSDSYGFQYAAFGYTGPPPSIEAIAANATGTPNDPSISEADADRAALANETLRYVSGQIVGNQLIGDIIGAIGGSGGVDEADDTCGFVKSGWGQTIIIAAAIGGAVAAFFSGGLTLGWGIAAQVAVSASIGIAIALLTPTLIDLAAGTLIDGLENGNQGGNAVVSGAGAYNAFLNESRGIPVQPAESVGKILRMEEATKSEYLAMENLDTNPLDASNPNSVLGSLSFAFYTAMPKSFTSSSITRSLSSLITAPTKLLSGKVNAATAAEYTESCEDPEILAMGAAADPFCNPKGGINPSYINTDPGVVLDYMLENNHMDEVSGAPTSEEFKDYIATCINRETPIGTYTEENTSDLNKARGVQCMDWESAAQANEHFGETVMTQAELEMYRMFRLFYIDYTIVEGMDNGFERVNTTTTTARPTPTSCSGPATLSQAISTGWGGYSNGRIPESSMQTISFDPAEMLHPDAACGLEALNEAYKERFNTSISITDSYRSYADQVAIKRTRGNFAAPPGFSNHGWGLALDLGGGINSFGTTQHNWMKANASKYGWVNPPWAQADGRKPEAWHWEYAKEVQ